MHPIDTKTGKPWAPQNSAAKLQQVYREAEDDLNRLDELKSGGRLCAATAWSTMVIDESTELPDGQTTYPTIVDPGLSALKHSGRDSKILRGARWAKFCAEPRCEDDFIQGVMMKREAEERERKYAKAAAIEKQLEDSRHQMDANDLMHAATVQPPPATKDMRLPHMPKRKL